MGCWGFGIYSNDLAMDIKDTYRDYLEEGFSNDEAEKGVISEYQEVMNTDEEPLFWYTLAHTEWKLGRLSEYVLNEAVRHLDHEGGSDLFETEKDKNKWRKTLSKIRNDITSPMPAEKKIRQLYKFTNPWNIGDVYAYKIHDKHFKDTEFYGKYLLIQKVGESEYEDKFGIKKYNLLHMYNACFDEIPYDIDISTLTIMPCFGYEESLFEEKIESRYISLWENMIEYKCEFPEKHLTFLKNAEIDNRAPEGFEDYSRMLVFGYNIEYMFIWLYNDWNKHNIEYINKEFYIDGKPMTTNWY